MQVYAHRAGRGLAPENTLCACETAIRLGVDVIDFDIGMTKDGFLVVSHDSALNPDITKGADGKFITEPIALNELHYKQLLTYDVGQINPAVEYASYFPSQQPAHNVKIPLLQEAISYVQSIATQPIGFQIEIKTDPRTPHLTASPELFAQALLQVLKSADIEEKTEVQSFDFRTLLALQKLAPDLKTSYLTLPQDIPYSHALWTAGHDIKNYDNSYLKMIRVLGGSCWCPFQMDVTPASIEEARRLALKVVPWGYPEKEGTEFNYAQIVKLIEWGVDGIITDRPDLLKRVLEKK